MIQNMIKKKGRTLTIISVLLLIIVGSLTVYFGMEARLFDVLKPVCEINKVEDVNICYKKNRYVKVNAETVYSTNYAYFKGEKEVAEYVDLDLDGYSFISLIKLADAEELFGGTVKPLTGKLSFFQNNEIHNGILQKIKQDYMKDFKEQGVSEEDVLASFHPVQLNSYQDGKIDDSVLLIVLGCGIIFSIVFLIKGIMMMIQPEKTKMMRIHEEEIGKLEYEMEHAKKFDYKKRIVTEHYVIDMSSLHFKAYRHDQIVWIYLYVRKRNGIEVSKSYLVKLKNGKQFYLPKNEELIAAIMEQNSHILIGYTDENKKAYQEIKKQKDNY